MAAKRALTDHFNVLEAGEHQVLEQLAADSSRSDDQHLAGCERVGQVFWESTDQLGHVTGKDGAEVLARSG